MDSSTDGIRFATQQSAEKAVKTLHIFYKQAGWGHVIAKMMIDLPSEVKIPPDLIEKARVLDNFYIPTRDANQHPSGAPFENYGSLQSNSAILYACDILEFSRYNQP